jgi:hypothetical protein
LPFVGVGHLENDHRLQQVQELFDGQTGLLDDGTQDRARQIAAREPGPSLRASDSADEPSDDDCLQSERSQNLPAPKHE